MEMTTEKMVKAARGTTRGLGEPEKVNHQATTITSTMSQRTISKLFMDPRLIS